MRFGTTAAGLGLFFLGIATLVAACSPADQAITNPDVRRVDAASSASSTKADEQRALGDLARIIAQSLGSNQFRGDIKKAMHDAPFREHKLELSKYLTPSVLARAAAATGTRGDQITALVGRIRPLEIYVPVAEHRETWTGDVAPVVVAQLEEGDPLIAFDSRGKTLVISPDAPPATPVISIVPVETRFNEPLTGLTTNLRDQGGRAIGTLATVAAEIVRSRAHVEECGQSCGGGYSQLPGPIGLYMSFSRIDDMGEPWFRGDPEIEVHVHGPPSGGNAQYGADLSCSGEYAQVFRVFDQNGGFWNGMVLLFSKDQSDVFNAEFLTGHHILFWEDDDTACAIKTDTDMLKANLQATASVFGTAAVWAKSGSWLVTAGAFVAAVLQNADWLQTNDDFLGTLITKEASGNWWTDANFTLMKGAQVNGRAMLEWKYQQ